MAQIKRLTLTNWRCIRADEIEVKPRMLLMSDGPGPGKTSIESALAFALLGSCQGTAMNGAGADALRTFGQGEAEIEVEIEDEHGTWQLGRRIAKSSGAFWREDGGAKQQGPHLRFEESFGIPMPAMFPNVRARAFLEMSKDEREKVVLAACGSFTVSRMIEKAGELWPQGWELADVLKLLGGGIDNATVKDGMQRIHNKAKKGRQTAQGGLDNHTAAIAALEQAAEATAPEVAAPTEATMTQARLDLVVARNRRDELTDKNRDYEEAERAVAALERDAGEPLESLRLGHVALSGDKGALVPKIHDARQAIAEMNNQRAKAGLPAVHTLEDLGSPPAMNETLFKLASKGCPACTMLEEHGADGVCPHTGGDPQIVEHMRANEQAIQRTFAEARKILEAEAELKGQMAQIDRQIEDSERKLDAAKEYSAKLDEANAELVKLPAPDEGALEAATVAQNDAQERLSGLERASGAGDAVAATKEQVVDAQGKRTQAKKAVARWKALETVTDPAGELATRWAAEIGGRFVEALPKISAALAPTLRLPEGVDPIRVSWYDGECHIVRDRAGVAIAVPWRLGSRGERIFGVICVAATWAIVTGCMVVVVDDVDALGSLLPLVLDGLYGTGLAGNVVLAGVGATMAAAVEQCDPEKQWTRLEVVA